MNGSDMRVTNLIMKVQMFGVSANQRLKLVKQVARVKYPKRQHKDANWDDLCQSLCMQSKQDQKKKKKILKQLTK
jgi:chorismate mutase